MGDYCPKMILASDVGRGFYRMEEGKQNSEIRRRDCGYAGSVIADLDMGL